MIRIPRVVFYARNFNNLAKTVRAFSSKSSLTSGGVPVEDDPITQPPPEREVSLLVPLNKRVPLPGNVGPIPTLSPARTETGMKLQQMQPTQDVRESDVFSAELPQERYLAVMSQLLLPTEEPDIAIPENRLECTTQVCPQLLKKDLQRLFPDRDIMTENTVVISFCAHTQNDMSAWSEAVEVERDILTAQFIAAAATMCLALRGSGYWADFIDPSSGRPYLGAYTNYTLFETDGWYRNLGFTIEDLGCCKVITHRLWGSHIFVASFFTNAPLDSPELQQLVKEQSCQPPLGDSIKS